MEEKKVDVNQFHECGACHTNVSTPIEDPMNNPVVSIKTTRVHVCFTCHPVHGGSVAEQVARTGAVVVASCYVCHQNGDTDRLRF